MDRGSLSGSPVTGSTPDRHNSPPNLVPTWPTGGRLSPVCNPLARSLERGWPVARAETALLTDDARLLNRELSWLDYNARVLARASDPGLPLLERSRNCAYFSSNLDEFFQVRVAGLTGQEEAGLLVRSPDGRTAPETLAAIREKTLELTAAQAKLWKRELRPALADAGVIVGEVEDCNRKELEELEQRFERDIFPILTPLAVGPGQPFPYISPLSLSLGIFVRDE